MAWEKTLRYQRKVEEAWKTSRKRAAERRKAKYRDITPPPIEVVLRLRNWLLIAALLCLFPASINVFTKTFYYEIGPIPNPYGPDYWTLFWYSIPVKGWFLSVFFLFFAALIDFIIFKRGGESILEW